MISFSSSYSQNFDSLASSGTALSWTNDVTLPGWFLFRQPATGPVALASYAADSGSGNSGSFFSYGSTNASDRALGGLGSGGNYFGSPGSGDVAGWIALALTNNSGTTINALDLSFNGEQWRNGGNTSAQSTVLEYGFGGTFAAVTNWIAPGGNFNWTSPVASSTAAAVNGNSVAGRVSNRGGSLQNLGWLANSNLWFRWIENNDAGADHGLAIDDLSINLGASLPVVTISSLDAAAAEQGGDSASLRISRDGSSAAALTVNLNLAGSASLNSDYSLSTSTAGASISVINSGSATALIPAGQSWLDVIITPINDNLIEGGETVQLSLASSSSYASGSPVSATVNITDDEEGAGSIQITEYMYNGAGGLGEFVEFTNLSNNVVNMAGWSFDDNTRTPGSQDLSGFGIINPGESVILTESTAAAFRSVWSLADNVKVIGGSTNNLGRADEINLYDASGALVDRLSYDDQTYTGTIRSQNASGWAPTGKLANFVISTDWKLAIANDDQNSRSSSGADLGNPGHFNGGGAGVLLIQSGGSSSLVEGGATDTISLALRSQPSADVVIELNGGSQLSPSAASLSFTTANWSTAQSISLSAIDDLLVEGSHSGSLSFGISSADASYGGLAMAPLTVVIADNDLIGPPPSIAEATAHGWIDLPATGAGGWLSGVLDDPTDPARSLGIDFYLADLDTPLANLQLGVSSSNQVVVSNANLMLSGSGANRNLQITPSGAGLTTITVTVADGSSSASYEFSYGASAASPLPASSRFHTGTSDASSAIAIDANWMLVADDEDQILRLYSRQQSGLPQAGFDFSSSLGLAGGSEVDLEASSRSGNTIYWLGSHGNNTSGADRPNRERLFATALSGSGSDTSLSFLGDYRYLEDDLIAWDAANGNALGLAASAAAGVLPEQAAGFNIEGLCIAPDGSSAYLAFRAPTISSGASGGNQRALIIPVTNFTSLVAIGGGSPGAAQFGNPISLDLGGRAIRSIEANASGEYLIIAGPSGAATGVAPADFRLFSWSGNAADAPVLRQADLSALLSGGSFEAIVEVPNALNAGSSLQLLSDNGDTVWYGNGVISKDLEIGAGFGKPLQKFRSDWLSLGPAVIPTGSIALSSSYSQNFDGLINSASASWSDNQIPGWYAARSGSGSTIVAGSGSSNSGNLYSFGVDGSSDRALGSVGSSNPGNLFWGARFYNDTGRSLDTLYLSYRGEQWRNSGEASSQGLELQWRIGGSGIGGSSLADTGWTSAPQLGFSAPVSGGSAGALNGNLAANSRQLSGSLSGLGLAAGQDLWLRWSDPNHSGADHGLAIDDLVVSSSPLPALRIIPSGADTSVSETGPSSDSIALALSTNPSSPVSVTLTADSQLEISADGSNFSSSLTLLLSDTNPRSVTVRAIDDELLETAIHAGTIRTQVSSADPAYDGLVISDLGVQVTDNEQLAVVTAIHSIQGSGATSPMLGQRKTVEGVVVASFPGSNGLNGFYLQEEDADADSDPTSSEAIFVYDPNGLVSGVVGSGVVGSRLRLTGTVAEYSSSASAITGTTITSSLTQLTNISGLNYLGTATLPSITTVTLPVADAAVLERYEGMRLQIAAASGDLVVTDTFGLGRYGEVGLSAGGRLTNYTQNNNPSASGYAAYLNDLLDNYITLDDGSSLQNPVTVIHGRGGNPLSASNTLRGGDTIASIAGVLDERFDGYRIQTTTGADFSATNPRSDAPASLGGSLRVASFNLLNFFNGNGNGGGFPTSRGADSAYEYTRQFDKTLDAILSFDADILGYNEIENDGYGANSAVASIVNGLNNVLGANLYGYVIPRSADLNLSGGLGGDEIAVGFLYRTDRVRLAAGSQVAALQSGSFTQGAARVQRPALAASFERIETGVATGEQFTAVVTHLKSKGSSAGGAGDADAGDGQGLSNGSRSRAASELADWLASSPTGSSDPDVLILGDLNSYLQEDPIRILASRGYRSLFDADSYSYQFNGQWGSLDHMLASDSLYIQVSGSGKWHINSDEPIILDYNIEFKSTAQQTSFYNADPFRTSDHDPLLAGFSLTPTNRPPTSISISASSCDENIAAGSSIAILSSSDPDTGNSFTYTLVAGGGAADNDSFSIFGSNLIINSSPNYEANSFYSLRLRSTDQGGLFTEKEFTFLVNNLIEEISSDASTTLPSDHENLILTGNSNINGTGNSSDNSLTGNAGQNSLYGLAGNDRLYGSGGNDTLDGGLGDDTMNGGAGNDTFYVNSIDDFCYDAPGQGIDTVISSIGWALDNYIENLTLTGGADINAWGNEWNNLLIGNSGNNVLNGNGGIDTMIGGLGDDKYVVDNIADIVTEDISGGLDWVESSVNWIMGSNLENLILTGGGNLSGAGNALDNRIKGNTGDNILDGGQGRDNLIGDAGADIFKFSNLPSYGAGGADRILDFSGSSGDRLLISKAAFGIANASASLINTNSTDLANALKTNNLFVYNTSNGHLYHNANGSAGSFGNGGIFAVLTNTAALQADWIGLY
jgi:predicted extracellular nuclease